MRIDPDYEPQPTEQRDIFGIRFEQGYNALPITRVCLENVVTRNRELPAGAADDLLLALITLKYTQSNSVCYAWGGQTIGVGAGPAEPRTLHPARRRQGRQLAPAPPPQGARAGV